ncbi:MAG: LptF/LptG family permease [Simkania sp.]|nr:LptF/LptG family permease [Simkania sp.]
MISILWRYLAGSFLRIFLFCLTSFVTVLLVMRLEEIARFASAGAPLGKVLLFTFYQIPYILPIAIPISCLIAAFLLFYRMSISQELTSLRAAGISLQMISTPFLFLSAIFMMLNFIVSAELAPLMRSHSKELILQTTTTNPLVLLQKDSLIKFKRAYIDMRSSSSVGNATDVLFIAKNTSTKKLSLMTAKELEVDKGDLKGKQVSFISSLDPKMSDRFDHLVIENQAEMTTAADGLSQFWEDAQWQLQQDYLPLRLLFAKEFVEQGTLFSRFDKAQVEFARRFSLAIATITFTMIGLSFGLQINREPSKKSILWAIGLTLAFLVVFIAAKSLKTMPCLAFSLYLLPHPLIVLFCMYIFNRSAQGVVQSR